MEMKNWTHPGPGPPWVRSNTWRGFNSHWNFCNNLAPWFPPLLGLMKTRTGVTLLVGIGFITKVFCSPFGSFGFFFEPDFFLGDFLSEDLKLPRLGSLTIHDGGTMILDWVPVETMRDIKTELHYVLNAIWRHNAARANKVCEVNLIWVAKSFRGYVIINTTLWYKTNSGWTVRLDNQIWV